MSILQTGMCSFYSDMSILYQSRKQSLVCFDDLLFVKFTECLWSLSVSLASSLI